MTVPPETESPEEARQYFKLMKEHYDRLKQKLGLQDGYLSMGMSNDYKIAIEEGANVVRIGRLIFE